ncbi:MAG: nucleotidyltransferase domain-containing protein [Chitinophagales bacterium]
MLFGLESDDINKIHSVFSRYPQIEKVIIYGSRAKGNYRPGSDIDLVLLGEFLNLSIQLELENELDDLLLPYKIDIALLHKIENKDLLDHIDRIGKVFYEKSLSTRTGS